MNRSFQKCLVIVGAGLSLSTWGRIVHTPSVAIASGTNPAIINGAAWSVHRRCWWNSPDTAAKPFVFNADPRDGTVGLYGNDSRGTPFVSTNPTQEPIISTDLHGSPSAGFIQVGPIMPGEIVLHPAEFSGTDPNRVVLRFTVPRSGRYSLNAVFRTLNGSTFANSQAVDVEVLLDRALLFQTDIVHPSAQSDRSYSFENKYLLAGQVVDFVVGPGLTEGTSQANWGDATGLTVSIVEEDEQENPVDAAWDLGPSFFAAWQQTTRLMPFPTVESGTEGSWSFHSVGQATFITSFATMDLLDKWTRDQQFEGPRVSIEGTASATEHVSLYDPAATVSTIAGMGSDKNWGTRTWMMQYPELIGPGEVTLHPASDRNLVIRFTVPEDGRYVVSYALRDLSRHMNPEAAGNGVIVAVTADGALLDESLISFEQGPAIIFRQLDTPPMMAGTAVDLIVNNNGNLSYDGTGGRVQVIKLRDNDRTKTYCAADALRDNVNGDNMNPFVDAKGATWTMGKSLSPFCADLVALLGQATTAKLKEWYNDAGGTLYANIPCFYANTTSSVVESADDSTIQPGEILSPREFYVHPSSIAYSMAPVYSVLRFTAPEAGVYSVRAGARDIHSSNGQYYPLPEGTGGVVIHVMGPGQSYLASGEACSDLRQVARRAHLAADGIFLNEGESIDLCVAPHSGRDTSCDATAVYETITRAECKNVEYLGVDIVADGSAQREVFRGRVGWTGQVWRETCVDGAVLKATQLRAGKNTAKAVFTLQRNQGRAEAAVCELDNPLMANGVLSTGPSDGYSFSFENLQPNTDYRLYLYGCTLSGDATAEFNVNGMKGTPKLSWTRPFANDVAILSGRTDGEGRLSGTFCATGEGTAVFCGLQLEGEGFPVEKGLVVTIR